MINLLESFHIDWGAFPSTGTGEEGELDGKECQQVRSCFANGPTTDEHESCQLDSLASD